MEEDGKRSGVGGEDDDFGDTTVEGLGGLVGALLQLTVVGGLLDQIEDVLGQGGVGDGPGGGVVLRHFWEKVGGWGVRSFVIWLARRFLAVCSPGVHGRRVECGKGTKSRKLLQEEVLESENGKFCSGLSAKAAGLGVGCGPKTRRAEQGPPFTCLCVYGAFDSLHQQFTRNNLSL